MPILSVYDRERFSRIVESQHHIITRAQALDCGMTRSMITYRIRPEGPWRAVLPSVYLTVTGIMTSEQREVAALLYAGPSSVITGPAAVRRHGIPCAVTDIVDVLVPASSWKKGGAFARVEHTTRMPAYRQAGPIRYAALPRAIADAARRMERYKDLETMVCAAIQRNRCTIDELMAEHKAGPMRGSRSLGKALREASAGIWSSTEGDFKRLVDRSDLEQPVYNAMLFTTSGKFIGCADAWWQRAGVAAEIDSRTYHLNADGYAKTMAHHNRLTKAGVIVLHWLPSTVNREPDRVIADLREALRAGNRRSPLAIATFVQAGDGLVPVSDARDRVLAVAR